MRQVEEAAFMVEALIVEAPGSAWERHIGNQGQGRRWLLLTLGALARSQR
jgi:hypothetical protein